MVRDGVASGLDTQQPGPPPEWQLPCALPKHFLIHKNPLPPRRELAKIGDTPGLDLSAPEYQGEGAQATFSIPGFVAHCEGRALGVPADRLSSDWADCSMTEGGEEGLVAARVYPVDGELLCHVAISFSHELG